MEKKVFIAILSGGNTTNAQHLFQEKEEENIGFRYNNNTFIFSADSKENACEIIKDVIDVSYDGNLLLH